MVTQSTIEAQFDLLEDSDFTQDFAAFSEAQPYLAGYLATDDVDAFTDGEQSLLFLSVLVIYQSIAVTYGKPRVVLGEEIATEEENILEVLQAQESSIFRHRLDAFFDNTQEEDLLAFIEDMLTPEEEEVEDDEIVTKEGREPLFVLLATCMQVLLKAR